MWLQTHRPLWTQLCPKHFPTHCACRKLMTFRRVYICSFQFIFYFLFPSWFYIFFKKLIHTWFQYWVNNWFYSSKPFCSRFSPFRWSKKKKKSLVPFCCYLSEPLPNWFFLFLRNLSHILESTNGSYSHEFWPTLTVFKF